jgi:hypothetical protein
VSHKKLIISCEIIETNKQVLWAKPSYIHKDVLLCWTLRINKKKLQASAKEISIEWKIEIHGQETLFLFLFLFLRISRRLETETQNR